jgi:rSAM/selenodomain-associated transferase 1
VSEIPLILFAKAPIAGKVKTRLQSHCSARQAAEIAEILLQESIIKSAEFWPGPVILSVSLGQNHPFLQAMCSQYSLRAVSQCEGDLGAKMLGAFSDFGYPCAILGCDAPHVQGSDLQLAHQHLSQGRNVIGPSQDGGYYLIGLTGLQKSLFSDMPWGSDAILSKTLARSNPPFEFISELNDVDEWADLAAAEESLPRLKQYLADMDIGEP